jgi:hypothetical protein
VTGSAAADQRRDVSDLAAVRGKQTCQHAGTASGIQSGPALRRCGAHDETVVANVVIPRRSHAALALRELPGTR